MVWSFQPFEVTTPHVVYACVGAFIVLFGLFSLFVREKLDIGQAPLAFLFGVIIGPYGANLLDPQAWGGAEGATTGTITLEITRVVHAIGVFAIGVELPKDYLRVHWKSLAFLLGPVMISGWFISAAFIYALIPGLNFLSSLTVAACLTPTDPILAAAVVGGKWADKHIPGHIRHLLAAESGCNDGVAFPFLFIALYLTLDSSIGLALRDWFVVLWMYQVLLGIAIGVLLGLTFRYLLAFCERKSLMDRQSYVAQYISLVVLTVGVTALLGSDDLLAAFACGTAFSWDGSFDRQTEESVFSSVIDLLFNIACFVYLGAWMPFHSFVDDELNLSIWRLIVIAILVLLFKRLPVTLALYKWIPEVKTFREAIFTGHFGPIGVGAVFISTLALEYIETHAENNEHAHQIHLLSKIIQPVVAFLVLCSIVIHGLSITSFTLGKRVHTVSRTWSRVAALPEWMNQARLVHRGADIVIDHDSDMERGEVDSDKIEDFDTLTPPSIREKISSSRDTLDGDEHRKAEESVEGCLGAPQNGDEPIPHQESEGHGASVDNQHLHLAIREELVQAFSNNRATILKSQPVGTIVHPQDHSPARRNTFPSLLPPPSTAVRGRCYDRRHSGFLPESPPKPIFPPQSHKPTAQRSTRFHQTRRFSDEHAPQVYPLKFREPERHEPRPSTS